jgi:PIN like domain
VEIHKDHFESRSRDDVWLPEVGRRGWAVITKDERFRSRQIEIAALLKSRSPAFVLSSGNTTGIENASAILIAMPQMLKLIARQPPPFIAKISAAGTLKVVLTQGDLLKRVQ